jgi:hypothetical protein
LVSRVRGGKAACFILGEHEIERDAHASKHGTPMQDHMTASKIKRSWAGRILPVC